MAIGTYRTAGCVNALHRHKCMHPSQSVCVAVPGTFLRPRALYPQCVCWGLKKPSAAVWSIPHRGYCSSFLINYFRQKPFQCSSCTPRPSPRTPPAHGRCAISDVAAKVDAQSTCACPCVQSPLGTQSCERPSVRLVQEVNAILADALLCEAAQLVHRMHAPAPRQRLIHSPRKNVVRRRKLVEQSAIRRRVPYQRLLIAAILGAPRLCDAHIKAGLSPPQPGAAATTRGTHGSNGIHERPSKCAPVRMHSSPRSRGLLGRLLTARWRPMPRQNRSSHA